MYVRNVPGRRKIKMMTETITGEEWVHMTKSELQELLKKEYQKGHNAGYQVGYTEATDEGRR